MNRSFTFWRILTVLIVLGISGGAGVSAQIAAQEPRTAAYHWDGGSNVFLPEAGLSAIRFEESPGRAPAAAKMAADLERASLLPKSEILPGGIVIVEGAPAPVRQVSSRLGLAVSKVYPVFRSPYLPDTPIVVTEEIALRFRADSTAEERQEFLAKYQLAVRKQLPGGTTIVAAPVSGGEAIELASRLNDSPVVEFAEPDYLMKIKTNATPKPNDTFIDGQWHIAHFKTNTLSGFGTPNADCDVYSFWNLSKDKPTQGEGIVVAVIDTGVDMYHSDLVANLVAGYDYVDDDSNPHPSAGQIIVRVCDPDKPDECRLAPREVPPNSHGTSCAGIIAAVQNNGIGVSGIAPKARIMPLRALSAGGSGQWSWIADSMYFAANNGADIISMSLGGLLDGPGLQAAARYCVTNGRNGRGAVVLASSGNEYGTVAYPAGFDQIISVGAISDKNTRVSYSNGGPGLDIVAPSMDMRFTGTPSSWIGGGRYTGLLTDENRTGIWTTDISGIYGSNTGGTGTEIPGDTAGDYTNTFNGTSAACPVAAGCVALILAREPNLTWTQVRSLIRQYADLAGGADQYLDPTAYPIEGGEDFEGDPCAGDGMFSPDFGYGRINPYRVAKRITKPIPFRNVYRIFDHDWTSTTDTMRWQVETLSAPIEITVDVGGEEDLKLPINVWTWTPDGWEETVRYEEFKDEEAQFDVVDNGGFIDNNPDGYYPAGTNQVLKSPAYPLEGIGRRAMVVLEHRWSFEIREKENKTYSMDVGYVEVKLSKEEGGVGGESRATAADTAPQGTFFPIGVIRGTSGRNTRYQYEDNEKDGQEGKGTVWVRQAFPVGEIGDAQFIEVRIRFASQADHNPEPFVIADPVDGRPLKLTPSFGWTIRATRILQYDLNETDFEVTRVGAIPDWSNDGRFIYHTTDLVDGAQVFFKPVDQPYKWPGDSGVQCDEYFTGGAREIWNGTIQRDRRIRGLDFHPVTNRVLYSFDTTNRTDLAALFSETDEQFDRTIHISGESLKALDARYSADGTMIVFSDGAALHLLRTDGSYRSSALPMVFQGTTLSNVRYPVFFTNGQRIVFSAAMDPSPGAPRDLFVYNRLSGAVSRVFSWPLVDVTAPDVSPDGKMLVFSSTAVSSALNFMTMENGLFALTNFEDVVLRAATPRFTDIPRSVEGYNHMTPRFSPDGKKLVYALARTDPDTGALTERLRVVQLDLAASSTTPPVDPYPTPTIEPPATPLPTITPLPTTPPEKVEKIAEYDFSQSNHGWFLVVTDQYTAPIYTQVANTGLRLTAPGANTDVFGYLNSPIDNPASFIPVDNNTYTLVRWFLTAGPEAPLDKPHIRLRANSTDGGQDAQMIEILSLPPGTQQPDATKMRAYDMILSPPPATPNRPGRRETYTLSMDLINVDGANSPDASVTLHKIEVYRIPILQIAEATQVLSQAFEKGVEGWTPVTIANHPDFFPPNSSWKNGALVHEPIAGLNTFGYWYRDAIPFDGLMNDFNLFMIRADYTVYSSAADPLDTPGFRFRTFTVDYQLGMSRRLLNIGNGDQFPRGGVGTPYTYTTYFRPTREYTSQMMNLAFDVAAFAPERLVGGEAGLKEVKVYLIRFADYPIPPSE